MVRLLAAVRENHTGMRVIVEEREEMEVWLRAPPTDQLHLKPDLALVQQGQQLLVSLTSLEALLALQRDEERDGSQQHLYMVTHNSHH